MGRVVTFSDLRPSKTTSGNVCFTPESGLRNSVVECPLCAKSRLVQCSKSSLFDSFVGDGEYARWNGKTKRLCGL